MAKKRQKTTPVEFTIRPPVVFIEEDLHSLSWCYQIHLSNRGAEPLRIVAAETLLYDSTRLVLEEHLGRKEIRRHAKPANAARLWFQPEKYTNWHRPVIPGNGELRWSDNFFVRPRGCWATAVVHRFVLEDAQGGRFDARCRVPLWRNRQATRLRLPFDGWWQMLIGHEHFEHHMRGGGGMGLDFIGLCDEGAPHRGTGEQLEDWACYRRDVRAPAAGTVVGVRNGSIDSPPGLPRSEPVNSVVLDVGNDEKVFLAHLVPGSIVVEEGDTVEPGQLLGLCGSSGYSLIPHVHVGLSRKGVGAPIIFANYRLLRPLEDEPDRFSLVQTVDSGVIRHGEIVCHAG